MIAFISASALGAKPRERGDRARASLREPSPGALTRPLPSPLPPATKGPLLVVDDDRDIREALAAFLAAEGYPVEIAGNGREALRYLRTAGSPPCAIILDLWMPVMNGAEFRAEQRADPKLAAIPIVVISAADGIAARAAPLAPAAILPKPIDFDALLATVARFYV